MKLRNSKGKFQYITLSQLMSSVEGDFHRWSDAGLVDQLKLIKVIRECNEKLGIRIYDRDEAALHVTMGPDRKGRADLPLNFYKAEMAFGLHKHRVNSMLPIGPGLQQVFEPPDLCQVQSGQITNLTGCCLDGAGNCSWLIKTPLTQLQVEVTDIVPLEIFEGHDHFTEYSPNRGFRRHHRHHRGYSINIQEGFLETDFHEGIVYLSYLRDMRNEQGEDIVLFHPQVNEYYEWALKARILENILYNTEADVAGLLKDARNQRNLAFHDAVNFVMGKEAREWQQYEHEHARKFFHQYYQIFY